jgi:hypothetical protein
MDAVSAAITGGFIALTAVVIVVLVKVFTFSFLMAGVIGVPVALGMGIMALWLLAKI